MASEPKFSRKHVTCKIEIEVICFKQMRLDVTDFSSVQNVRLSLTDFAIDFNEWAVSVVVSEWYNELFENWLYWYEQLSTNMTLIVIAEDEFIYQKYHNSSQLKVISLHMNNVSMYLSK